MGTRQLAATQPGLALISCLISAWAHWWPPYSSASPGAFTPGTVSRVAFVAANPTPRPKRCNPGVTPSRPSAAPSLSPMKSVSLLNLWSFFVSLGRVFYGLGSKAPEKPFFQNPTAKLDTLTKIDCSGFVRLAIYRATGGAWKIPDGSQNQRAYFEQLAKEGKVREVNYWDAAHYINPHRLFICFIKPFENGCGSVGHVWLLVQKDGRPVTLESHGGYGVHSRPWDTEVLQHQVYSVYEVPTS